MSFQDCTLPPALYKQNKSSSPEGGPGPQNVTWVSSAQNPVPREAFWSTAFWSARRAVLFAPPVPTGHQVPKAVGAAALLVVSKKHSRSCISWIQGHWGGAHARPQHRCVQWPSAWAPGPLLPAAASPVSSPCLFLASIRLSSLSAWLLWVPALWPLLSFLKIIINKFDFLEGFRFTKKKKDQKVQSVCTPLSSFTVITKF